VSRQGVKAHPTARQQQCLALIASGLTNKEIAHQLSITERGVAALVSRLLMRFEVSNRAGLVARVMAERLAEQIKSEAPKPSDAWTSFMPTLERDLEAYRRSPFFVMVTLGREQRMVFLSDVSRNLTAGAPYLAPVRDPDEDATAAWWRQRSDETFTSGVAAAFESMPLRWLRADGTWRSSSFSCLAQPLRDSDNRVQGILWICTPPER
jgi:DNA-binding CsgD family transcriptional regulator